MKTRLLDILVCPFCGAQVRLHIFVEQKGAPIKGFNDIRCRYHCALHNVSLSQGPHRPEDKNRFNCSECYETEILEGVLTCLCGRIFPITGGVPRMLKDACKENRDFTEKYRENIIEACRKDSIDETLTAQAFGEDIAYVKKSFSIEWEKYRYSNLSWESEVEDRKKYFLHYTQAKPESLKGKLLLDAGCGNGTLTSGISQYGIEVIGMDLSSSIVRAQQNKNTFALLDTAPFVHFLQGNICEPPFRKEVFDIIYSDGVLHHTPDTRKAFFALVPLVKKNAKYFVWLYRKDLSRNARIRLNIIHALKKITLRMPLKTLYYCCFVGAAIILGATRLKRALGGKTRRIIPIRLKTVNLFDTFSPKFDYCHTFDEVAQWYKDAGFSDITDVTLEELEKWGFGIIGTRMLSGERQVNCASAVPAAVKD